MSKEEVLMDELTIEQLRDNFAKSIHEFKTVYQKDIFTLNKILSTYEDKLSMLENQLFDLSYKQKQIIDKLNKSKEE